MIQEGNTKDDEAVHALEMGFIRVQLLNILKLTKKDYSGTIGKKSDYTSTETMLNTLFIHSNFKSNQVSKEAHSTQFMFFEQLEKLTKFLHLNNLRLRSKDDVLLGVEVTLRIPKEPLR